jgi:hypothetical protein
MSEKQIIKVEPAIKVLWAVLVILLALYGMPSVGSLVFMARVFPSLAHSPYGFPFWGGVKFVFDWLLPGIIYFFIAYYIFKLIRLISRGEPFSSQSPRYIRRIGYAVLWLAAVDAVVNAISVFATITILMDAISKPVFSAIRSILSTLLLGFGFLVIAKVLEVGVSLKHDQDLTV